MKNVWNSSDNGGNPPEGLDEKVRKGDLVRFTHFPSFNGFVGIYLGVDVEGGRSKWKFATDRGMDWVDPKGLSHYRVVLVENK